MVPTNYESWPLRLTFEEEDYFFGEILPIRPGGLLDILGGLEID